MATKDEEIEQLKGRVAELEATLRRERSRKETAASASDSTRDAMNKIADEYSRLFRGMTTAYLEGLNVATEAAGIFFKGVQESNQTKGASGEPVAAITDQARNLGTGCTTSLTDAINKAVEIPRRSVDKFYESYREPTTTA